MVERFIVILPQHSVNDEFAILVEWYKNHGEFVKKNEFICSAETTKLLFEIEADQDGYLIPLVSAGDEAKVGAPIAILSSDPSDTVAKVKEWIKETETPKTLKEQVERHVTKKAQILADRLGLDVNTIPARQNRLTAKDVQRYCDSLAPPKTSRKAQSDDLVTDVYPNKELQRLLIIGGGDGAVQILDALALSRRQKAVAIIDDNPELKGRTIMGVPIIGTIDLDYALKLFKEEKFDAAVISISTNIPFRDNVFRKWRDKGIPFANVIHPTAFLGMNSSMGTGNVILAFCHIGACAIIGDNNFLSAYCSIEHHCILGNNCSFGPAVIFSSRVDVKNNVRFGTGIFVEPFVKIGSNSVIASGTTLTGDIQAEMIVKSRASTSMRPLK